MSLAAGIGEELTRSWCGQSEIARREDLAVLCIGPCLEANRDGPLLRRVWLAAGAQEKALLRDRDLAFGRFPEDQERLAWLSNQALHDLVYGFVTGSGLGIPEVLGGGVPVEVGGEIIMHARAEGLRAKVILNCEQHVAGFAIGNAVEHLVDFVGGFGLGADGAGGGLSIEVERAVFVGSDQL